MRALFTHLFIGRGLVGKEKRGRAGAHDNKGFLGDLVSVGQDLCATIGRTWICECA
jgi:hypothetical protein